MTTIDQLLTWADEDDYREQFAQFADTHIRCHGAYSAEADFEPASHVAILGHYGAAQLVATLTGVPFPSGILVVVRMLDEDGLVVTTSTFEQIEAALEYVAHGGAQAVAQAAIEEMRSR